MYSTCLFCHATLGANEVIEHFPVGRRLAFDAAKGRLWVVCPHCERWNLSPIEERWEAIEECERLFRATVIRASTDNIGVAELREGTRLIRIGKPLRPEFAAWRYGDQFGRRRRKALWTGGGAALAAVGLASAVVVNGPPVGMLLAPLGALLWLSVWSPLMGLGGRRISGVPRGMRIGTAEGDQLELESHPLQNIEMRDDGHGALRVAYDYSEPRYEGDNRYIDVRHGTVVGKEGRWLASRIMPSVNGIGAPKGIVRDSVSWIDRAGGPEPFIPAMFAETRRLGLAYSPVTDFPSHLRLALEMALHEDLERRAMEDELKELEAAWKEADRIAALADNLFLGRDVNRRFKAMKRGRQP